MWIKECVVCLSLSLKRVNWKWIQLVKSNLLLTKGNPTHMFKLVTITSKATTAVSHQAAARAVNSEDYRPFIWEVPGRILDRKCPSNVSVHVWRWIIQVWVIISFSIISTLMLLGFTFWFILGLTMITHRAGLRLWLCVRTKKASVSLFCLKSLYLPPVCVCAASHSLTRGSVIPVNPPNPLRQQWK